MEKDAGSSVVYFLRVSSQRRDDLSAIRHWANLKTGVDGDDLWVKDLDYQQVHSKEVRSLSSKSAYFERDNHLFPMGSKLPERIVPSLLWTAIDRSIPVTMPALNHNFFGINEKIAIRLIDSADEHESTAMLVSVTALYKYMESAPVIRTNTLRWSVFGNSMALVIGRPLLPLPGTTFWSRGDMLIPAGLDFELYALAETVQASLNSARDKWLIWDEAGSYTPVMKTDLVPLSRSSVRGSKDMW
jgi:hypothetical protein